jgi:KipI family sensor histidine kinase inhibitor
MRRVLPYGERAVLLECADLADTRAVHAALGPDRWPEIEEVVAGAETLLLRLGAPLDHRRRQELATLEAPAVDPGDAAPITIDVHYDGEDLDEVADRLGLSPAEVVAAHTGQLWTVAFCGFAPGFGYLHGEHDRLRVPRRPHPRTSVPAGAVGLADRWSGIYPRSGPGGWQLIGHTDADLWDLRRDPPGLLQPGVVVRFRPGPESNGAPVSDPGSGAT